ncbi:MAG: reverse transcriptase domain-containing protein [Limisphaerales bacterium]
MDKWFIESVQPACGGRTFMVRFADDFIMGFESLEDARKVQRVIGKRFARFGLKINEQKTRMVRFKRPLRGGARAEEKPETFDFLGFTHYWGKSRQGIPVVKKQTARGRFARALRTIKEWGWKHRHLPLKEQQCKLNEKLRSHDAYYGVTGNHSMLQRLRWEVAKQWRKWLMRRNRGRSPNWQQFADMLKVFPLTPARVIHSNL